MVWVNGVVTVSDPCPRSGPTKPITETHVKQLKLCHDQHTTGTKDPSTTFNHQLVFGNSHRNVSNVDDVCWGRGGRM